MLARWEESREEPKHGRKRPAGKLPRGTLPDFVIIGSQKSGTTFLYDLLTRHPRVVPAKRKEVHYFDHYFGRGTDWYRSRFPLLEGGAITGEATPYYMFHPLAARRMAEVAPEARLISLLRNPADRAYSHYHMEFARGFETLSFEEALDAEEGRLRGERERMLEEEGYASFAYQHFSYLSRGVYVDQFEEWGRYFGPERLLVMKSEDLFGDDPGSLKRVLGFLGLPEWELGNKGPNVASFEGDYPPMEKATRRRLEGYFEPHNRRLYEYLCVDLGW